jgi:hypothetical protein
VSELNGIVFDLPEDQYHSHPALSSTQARQLLESPAKYHYAKSHPQPHKDAFDLGTAVHTKVLGVGQEAVVLDFPDFRTNAAKAARDEARAAGQLVITAAQMTQVDGMAEAVLAHQKARTLFEQDGNSEASVFATDPDTGVNMRARFDFLPSFMQDNPRCVDLKTTAKSAHPDEFAKTVANLGYFIQQEWYLHTYGIATGDFDTGMEFVVVETEAPHLVGVYPLSMEFAEIGRKKTRQALEKYALCAAQDIWPGYDTEADPLQPPTWLMFTEGSIA